MPELLFCINKNPIKLLLSLLITALFVIALPSCTTIQRKPLGIPLDANTANSVLTEILDQDAKVTTFWSIGTITVKDWKWDTDASILIVGQKEPFRIKIEITHQWKGPALHILIDEKSLEVLSFIENKIYIGPFSPKTLSRFIPGGFFNSGLIWSILRGCPYVLDHNDIDLNDEGTISLLDMDNREIETIVLGNENLYPTQTIFPDHGLALTFNSFQDNDGILYAEEVLIENKDTKHDLILKNSKMVYNQPIPDKIFTIQKLSKYEIVLMDEITE